MTHRVRPIMSRPFCRALLQSVKTSTTFPHIPMPIKLRARWRIRRCHRNRNWKKMMIMVHVPRLLCLQIFSVQWLRICLRLCSLQTLFPNWRSCRTIVSNAASDWVLKIAKQMLIRSDANSTVRVGKSVNKKWNKRGVTFNKFMSN